MYGIKVNPKKLHKTWVGSAALRRWHSICRAICSNEVQNRNRNRHSHSSGTYTDIGLKNIHFSEHFIQKCIAEQRFLDGCAAFFYVCAGCQVCSRVYVWPHILGYCRVTDRRVFTLRFAAKNVITNITNILLIFIRNEKKIFFTDISEKNIIIKALLTNVWTQLIYSHIFYN